MITILKELKNNKKNLLVQLVERSGSDSSSGKTFWRLFVGDQNKGNGSSSPFSDYDSAHAAFIKECHK